MNSNNRFIFCMQVWGSKHIDIFLQAGLPAQMVSGNLIDFPWLQTSSYEIFTLRSDLPTLEQSPLFQRLCEIIRVNFHFIDDYLAAVGEDAKWKLVRHCHKMSANLGDELDAGVFYLHPDQIWAQGSFLNAAKQIQAGYSAVLCPGPRTNAEEMITVIRDTFLSPDGSMPIPPRQLVEVGMQNLHSETISWNWDTEDYFKAPTYIYRNVKDAGMSALCFILHPLVIKPEIKFAPFKKIFDQDYLLAACPTFSKMYVVQDSDEILQFELSPQDMITPPCPYRWINAIKLLAWYAEDNYNWQHRLLVRKPIRIHSKNINEEDWIAVERVTLKNLDELDHWLKISDWRLVLFNPEHYLARFNGRHKFDPKAAGLKDKLYKAISHLLAREIYVWLEINEFYYPGELFTVYSRTGPFSDKYLRPLVRKTKRFMYCLLAPPYRALRNLKQRAAPVG